MKRTKQKRYHKNVFNKERSLDAGAELEWLTDFLNERQGGMLFRKKILDFNSLKSPHWNLLIMEVCSVGINLETLHKVKTAGTL